MTQHVLIKYGVCVCTVNVCLWCRLKCVAVDLKRFTSRICVEGQQYVFRFSNVLNKIRLYTLCLCACETNWRISSRADHRIKTTSTLVVAYTQHSVVIYIAQHESVKTGSLSAVFNTRKFYTFQRFHC